MVLMVISSSFQIRVALFLESTPFAFPVGVIGDEYAGVNPLPDLLDLFDRSFFVSFTPEGVELLKFGLLGFDQGVKFEEDFPFPIPVTLGGELVNR